MGLKKEGKKYTHILAKQPISIYSREMTAQEYPEIQTRKSTARLLTVYHYPPTLKWKMGILVFLNNEINITIKKGLQRKHAIHSVTLRAQQRRH